MSTDVIVVGCGPVGVMTALRCAQRGLSVVAIDKSMEIFPLPRAIGMDEEIQRLFQNAGLEAELAAVSTPIRGAEFLDVAGNRLVGLELPEGTLGLNGYPPMTMFEQPGLERALRAAAVAAGVQMDLGVRAISVENARDGVSLTIADEDGREKVLEAPWLVAADGAASTMRGLAGIVLEDQGFDEEWVVIDTTVVDPELSLPRMAQQICDPKQVITFVPGHQKRARWEFKVHDGDSGESLLEKTRLSRMLSRWVKPEQVRLDRSAVYRFHAVVADRFRNQSIFVAGDAAHQMPPFNGQGMNSGLRDAENLSWKLALVCQSKAGVGLLDTYDLERRPHARGQVQHAADAGRLINALSLEQDVSTEAGYGGGRPFPHIEAGFVCGDHPMVGHPIAQPTLDETRLDDLLGEGFALIGNRTDQIEMSPSSRSMWDRLGSKYLDVRHPMIDSLRPNGEIIIVRPDRYIAAVTTDIDTTSARLEAAITQ